MGSRVMTGVSLIVVGVLLYLRVNHDFFGPWFWTAVGAALTVGYVFTRSYGALVTGCLLMGYGIGAHGPEEWGVAYRSTVLGVGVGFVMIWGVQFLVEGRAQRWPLVPGILMILLGMRTWGRVWRFLVSPEGWPVILIIVGVLVLLGAFRKRHEREALPESD